MSNAVVKDYNYEASEPRTLTHGALHVPGIAICQKTACKLQGGTISKIPVPVPKRGSSTTTTGPPIQSGKRPCHLAQARQNACTMGKLVTLLCASTLEACH